MHHRLHLHRRLKPIVRTIKSMPSLARVIIGMLLLLAGALGILPILGFWMIPLGLLVLSLDFRWARRGYLTLVLWFRRWRSQNRAQGARAKARSKKSPD